MEVCNVLDDQLTRLEVSPVRVGAGFKNLNNMTNPFKMLLKRKRRLTVIFVYHKNGHVETQVKIDKELLVTHVLSTLKHLQNDMQSRLIRAGQLAGLNHKLPATRAFIAKTKVKDLH
jgi:hypothetical protein